MGVQKMTKISPMSAPIKYRKFKDGVDDQADYEGTRLLKIEQHWEMIGDCTDMLTFYQSIETNSFDSIVSYFKTRLNEIISENPWLQWMVVKRKNTTNFKAGMYYEKMMDKTDPSTALSFIQNDDIFTTTTYKNCQKIVAKHRLGIPSHRHDSNSFPFKFVVFYNSEKSKYAILGSFSHQVFDGCSCYQLWTMFGKNAQVVKLNPVRVQDYEDRYERETSMLGIEKYFNWLELIPLMFRGIYKAFRPQKYGKPDLSMFKLSTETIRNRKQDVPPPGFVSTNDIVNSWYMYEMGNIEYLEMAVNTRGRADGILENLSGNYLGIGFMTKDEFENAEKPREAVNNILQKRGMSEQPKARKYWYGYKALSTNWAGYYKKVDLPGLEETLHIPVYDMSHYKLFGAFCGPEDILVIFCPKDGEIGILAMNYSANGKTDSDYLNSAMVEGHIIK